MRLISAAAFFDKQLCSDAFGVASDFYAQLDLFDDNKRDGTTTVRRILSVADPVVMPASGAIILANHVYIVGNRADHEDVFANQVIRRGYAMQQSDGPASIKTIAQAAGGLAGVATFAAKVFVKELREEVQTSRMYPSWDIVVPIGTPVARNTVVVADGILYLCRESFITSGGFYNVQASQLSDTAPQTVSYTDRSGQGYDPATDTMTSTGAVSVPALAMRYEDYYLRLSSEAPKNLPGDLCLGVAKTSVPSAGVGDEWTSAAGVKYRVQAVADDNLGAWLLHSRRT